MTERDLFTIVVVGSMNPAIHHPYWYRQADLISQEELDQSLIHADTIFTPPVSQFKANNLSINCQPNRWEVRAHHRNCAQRIVEIATRVFDGMLPHTPVNACGFNFIFYRTCPQSSGQLLARVAEQGPIKFGIGLSAAELKITGIPEDNCVQSMLIGPTKENLIKFVANVNFSFPTGIQNEPFVLSPTFNQFFGKLSAVESQVQKLSEQFNAYASSS